MQDKGADRYPCGLGPNVLAVGDLRPGEALGALRPVMAGYYGPSFSLAAD